MLGTENDYGDRDGKLVKEGWAPGGGKDGKERAQADKEPRSRIPHPQKPSLILWGSKT